MQALLVSSDLAQEFIAPHSEIRTAFGPVPSNTVGNFRL
jgi:hypothetical protein